MRLSFLKTLKGHNGSIYKLIRGTDKVFYSLGGEGFLVEWNIDLDDGTLIAQGEDQFFSGLKINENIIVAGGFSGEVYWFDIQKKIILKRIQYHKKAVHDFILMQNILYSVSADGCLVSWNVKTMMPIDVFQINALGLRSIQIVANQIIVGGMDGYLYIIDVDEFVIVNRWHAHTNTVFTIQVNEDFIYSGGRDAILKKWSKNNFNLIAEVPAHWYTINDIYLDQNFLITISRDKKIRLWDTDLQLLQSLDVQSGGHINSVNTLCVTENSTNLITGSDDRTLKVWDIII
ncbi:MAG TPA: hypothetical protein PKD85_04210 [Saprospiraceae bacterium]|nr:hypothetical protein [Saprospiraceae bacterium]